jgi:hypothetical protein
LQEQKEKYMRQHPAAVRVANFWAKLVPSVKKQHKELELHYSGNPALTCQFIGLSETSFSLLSNVRPNERFMKVERNHFWITLWAGHAGIYELRDDYLDKISPDDVAADLLKWALRRAELHALPWCRVSGSAATPASGAIQYGG